jgi:hypothetical protein
MTVCIIIMELQYDSVQIHNGLRYESVYSDIRDNKIIINVMGLRYTSLHLGYNSFFMNWGKIAYFTQQ